MSLFGFSASIQSIEKQTNTFNHFHLSIKKMNVEYSSLYVLSMCLKYESFRYSNIQSFLSKSRLSLCLFVLSSFKHLVKNYPSRYFFNVASMKIKSCCLYWSYHSVPRGKKKGIQRRVPKMWFYSISMPRTSTVSGFQLCLSVVT